MCFFLKKRLYALVAHWSVCSTDTTLYGFCFLRLSPLSLHSVLPPLPFFFNDIRTQSKKKKDICCGTGTIGLTLAHRVKNLIGLEMNKDALQGFVFFCSFFFCVCESSLPPPLHSKMFFFHKILCFFCCRCGAQRPNQWFYFLKFIKYLYTVCACALYLFIVFWLFSLLSLCEEGREEGD